MIGTTTWVIGDGYIPPASTGPHPAMTSHDSACMLNANAEPARIEITVYFADREPAGPYVITIPGRRVHHQRFNDLTDPEPIPAGTDYSVVVRADRPVVVQHTRLDSRQAANALMTTIAFPVPGGDDRQ
ncbi:MAG: sensory rhodopsin transducer [Kribbellaceae bacterium]|nr:sensory rhodopsin transducer [Kribbellaceae bacterium]